MPQIDIVAVTGDIVDYRGWRRNDHLRTLRAANGYLSRLCNLCGVDPLKPLFIIPGNHDRRWSGVMGIVGWGVTALR
jgi:3',5'-cyclic AMP phosphodiesterase CpdA